jgi:hypothetical protein
MNLTKDSRVALRDAKRASVIDDNAVKLAGLIADGRLSTDIAVTCRGRKDGAGQQAIAVIGAMMLARFAGCRYLHSPFVSIAHATGSKEAWAARWEAFLNLGEGETLVPEDAKLVPLSTAVATPDMYKDQPLVLHQSLFVLPHAVVAQVGEATRAALRTRYWHHAKTAIPSHRAADGLTAAVHLRRGDVSATVNSRRHVPDEVVLRDIARLRKAVEQAGQTLTVNLYSEGDVRDFGAFAVAGCKLHISEDPFEDLHNMMTADILLKGRSNFSYLAALLSNGIVVDHGRLAPPFVDWLTRRADGSISIERLRGALVARMSWSQRLVHRARRCLRAGWSMSVR